MRNILRKNKREIIKENGAVSTLVLFTVLVFVAILSGSFMIVTSLQKSQLQSDLRIQDIYRKDVNNADEIYEKLLYEKMYIRDQLLIWLDGTYNTRNGNNPDSSKWEDLSGNGNDLNLVNIKANEDNSFSAIDQTSKAYIDINIEGSFTAEIVFKENANDISYLWDLVISDEEKFYLWNYPDGTTYSYRYQNNSEWNVNDDITNSVIELGKKSSISITFDNTTKKSNIYYNGNYIKTVTMDLYEGGFFNRIILMNSKDNERALINGNVYSFRLYNKVLQQDEILYNYEWDQENYIEVS